MTRLPRRKRVLARLIQGWSWVGFILDTPFRLPYVWAVDKAGILDDEGRIADWHEEDE